MKRQLSVSVEESLLLFLDSRPGRNRSEKLERILVLAIQMEHERGIRRELGRYRAVREEKMEREAWELTVSEAMWAE